MACGLIEIMKNSKRNWDQPQCLALLVLLAELPLVNAFDSQRVLLGTFVIVGTFVVAFGFLLWISAMVFPQQKSSSAHEVDKEAGSITDRDSDSTQSGEPDDVIKKDNTSKEIVAVSTRRGLWKTLSSRLQGSKRSVEDDATGEESAFHSSTGDTSLDISLSMSKLLSENTKQSFAAMAEAFVRSAAIAGTLPRDDDGCSRYSGSFLSVFDDSSCNTDSNGRTLGQDIPTESTEEAWLEFLEVPVAHEHHRSSLDLSKVPETEIIHCSVDL